MEKVLDVIGKIDSVEFPKYQKRSNIYNGNYLYTITEYKQFILEKLLEHIDTDKIICKKTEYNNSVELYFQSKIAILYLPEIHTRINIFDNQKIIIQKSNEWLNERRNLISASESGYLLGINGISTMITYFRNKLGLSASNDYIYSKDAIQHGNIYEDVTRAIYQSRHNVQVKEYGLIKTDKTGFLGASPDGIVISSDYYPTKIENSSKHKTLVIDGNKNSISGIIEGSTNGDKSRIGRLVEIKNPYSYDASNKIKPEYEIQIMQQQYVLDIPLCDFIKTCIIGSITNEKTAKEGYKPYLNIDAFLADVPDDNTIVKNNNIPHCNLTNKGMEKGVIIYYKNVETNEIVVSLYPLEKEYIKDEIVKWLKEQRNYIIQLGIPNGRIAVDYWYVASYFEKTVHYEELLFEKYYLPRLEITWKIINKLKQISADADGNKLIESYLSNIKIILGKPAEFYKIIPNHEAIMKLLTKAYEFDLDDTNFQQNHQLQQLQTNNSNESKTSKIKTNDKKIYRTSKVEYDF